METLAVYGHSWPHTPKSLPLIPIQSQSRRWAALHGIRAAHEAKLDRIRDSLKDVELEGCTFHPQILSDPHPESDPMQWDPSDGGDGGRRRSGGRKESIFLRCSAWARKKEDEVRRLREEKEVRLVGSE